MADDLRARMAIQQACKESWDCGYKCAVDALRDMASYFPDEQAKVALVEAARLLDLVKP